MPSRIASLCMCHLNRFTRTLHRRERIVLETLSRKISGACKADSSCDSRGKLRTHDPGRGEGQAHGQKILHAAIAGLPNAGKSTLLNYMVGEKVSAVSSKRHTTRGKMVGVMTVGDTQVYFHDTPGFVSHLDRGDYHRELTLNARETIRLVDATLLVVDASRPWSDVVLVSLYGLLEQCLRSPGDVVLVLNKVDLVRQQPGRQLADKRDRLLSRAQMIMNEIDHEEDAKDALKTTTASGNANGLESTPESRGDASAAATPAETPPRNQAQPWTRAGLQRYRDRGRAESHVKVFAVSARSGDGVAEMVQYLEQRARPGKWHFERGQTTNLDARFRATEIIRESLYAHLHKEIPYIITQHTRYFCRRKDGSMYLEQDLFVERESQKGIVLPKLRYIHRDVERDLAKLYGTSVSVHFNVITGLKVSIEEAIKAKKTKYGGTYRPSYKLVPLAFSTRGDHSASAHEHLVKDGLDMLKVEMDEEYLMAGEGGTVGILARVTGRLRQPHLSLATQKALAYCTLRCQSDDDNYFGNDGREAPEELTHPTDFASTPTIRQANYSRQSWHGPLC